MLADAPSNRLAQERSLYLRQHAQQPVDWYPWGEEALAAAVRQDRPILLSIGYSACHWCHVMAHESFDDPEVAAYMNAHFVNVKVDREERPDLDQLYQGAVQLLGGAGGWPLTVFLTPDRRPFMGGTYFPPDDRHGLPAFGRVLERLSHAWTHQRTRVEEQASALGSGLGKLLAHGLERAPRRLSVETIVEAGRELRADVAPQHGGFGHAPKFPCPSSLALLLRAWRRTAQADLLEPVLLTLERMAQGGIFDQLGGGFHRYAVDARWAVPHFEKMLYDNALLLHLYAEAQQASPRSLWGRVVEETVTYLARELTSPEGALYAAQDADSAGEEGSYFVWTPGELREQLGGPTAAWVAELFGVTESGNFEGGATVLHRARTVEQVAEANGRLVPEVQAELEQVRARLLAARERRPRPARDEKILAGWNGLAMRGLSLAARVFGRPEWAQRAARVGDFVLERLWDGRRLRRCFQDGSSRIDGFLEDYGGVAAGLCGLFQATFEPRYLEAASALVDAAHERFWDESKGVYRVADLDRHDLVVVPYALHDHACPSGASLLVEAQLALGALTEAPRFLARAETYLERMTAVAADNPFALSHLLLAADTCLDGAALVTLVGDAEQVSALVSEANRVFAPTFAQKLAKRSDGVAAGSALVCQGHVCRDPVRAPLELALALRALPAR